jgi:hypothetical protein
MADNEITLLSLIGKCMNEIVSLQGRIAALENADVKKSAYNKQSVQLCWTCNNYLLCSDRVDKLLSCGAYSKSA